MTRCVRVVVASSGDGRIDHDQRHHYHQPRPPVGTVLHPAGTAGARPTRCAVDRDVSRPSGEASRPERPQPESSADRIHSFFRSAAFEAPAHAPQIQRVLGIPNKRFTRTLVHFLTRPEVEALLAAPDQRTWFCRRDHAFLWVAVQTGLRLSEMTGLTREDVTLGIGAHLHVIGKGRKERCTPLAKPTVAVLTTWLREPPRGDGRVLFPNARGTRLSPDGVHYLLVSHSTAASRLCPSLKGKRVTVDVLRHTMALDLLEAGVVLSVIALWLGHESVKTTQIYLEATMAMKEQALAKTTPLHGRSSRYRPGDQLLGFLKSLWSLQDYAE